MPQTWHYDVSLAIMMEVANWDVTMNTYGHNTRHKRHHGRSIKLDNMPENGGKKTD